MYITYIYILLLFITIIVIIIIMLLLLLLLHIYIYIISHIYIYNIYNLGYNPFAKWDAPPSRTATASWFGTGVEGKELLETICKRTWNFKSNLPSGKLTKL